MPWVSTAVSVGGSLLGGLMGGGKKKAERAARDASARAQYELEFTRRRTEAAVAPYTETGRSANTRLAELLGIANPDGYAKRPELQTYIDQLRDEHFKKYGQDYNRNSNVPGQNLEAKKRYDEATAKWESGLKEYQTQNPNSRGSGDLLKPFDSEGFMQGMRDQGYSTRAFDSEGFIQNMRNQGYSTKAFSNEDFVKDPGYLARLLEGEQGEKRNLVARGASDSGQAMKELERYRQTYASNEFGNAFNRHADNRNYLSSELGNAFNRDSANKNYVSNEMGNAFNRDAADKTRTYGFLSGQSSQGLGAAQGTGNLGFNSASQSGQISTNNANNMLTQANMRDENRGNAFQSALGNLIYGMNRNNDFGKTPPYIPSTGGYSSPRTGSFASQFVG